MKQAIPQRKAIAMGLYKSGGKVGRPQKRYVLDTPQHERAETTTREREEHRAGHKEK